MFADAPLSLDSLLADAVELYKQEQYVEASEKINLLVDQASFSEDYAVQMRAYGKVAHFYLGRGNYDKALSYFFDVIDIAQNKLDTNECSLAKRSKIICDHYTGISEVYYLQKNYAKSEEYLWLIYNIIKEQDIAVVEAQVLNNLGELKRLQGDIKGGLTFYKKSLKIREALKNPYGLSLTLSNIGITYIELEILDSAKLFLDRGYKIAQEIEYTKMQVDVSRGYMNYYQAKGQLELARQWGQMALSYTQKNVDVNVLLPLYAELSTIYEELNILDSCAMYQKEWIKLSKELNERNNERLALEIEARFLIKEKEKELAYLREKDRIESQNSQLKNSFQWACILGLFGVLVFTLITLNLLRKKNKKLADSWGRINQQNIEKELLLKEIHHRVKNNLQVITSLLSLQSHSIEDDTIKALFSQSQHRINSMAMIHKMLYQSNDFSKINCKDYLEELIDKLIVSFKGVKHNIQLDMDIPELFLNLDTSIPLGLLINEIITNALKYGLPNGQAGLLTVKMKQQDATHFVLEIGDDGVGYTGDLKSKAHTSLGLRLIQQLAVQLNGSVKKKWSKKGTCYVLHFQEIDAA